MSPLSSTSTRSTSRLHSTNEQSDVKVNLKGFAVGNGCTDPKECEFLNDYSPYLMEMVRNFGYISDEMYKEIDAACGNAGKELPKDCEKLLDRVDLQGCRWTL